MSIAILMILLQTSCVLALGLVAMQLLQKRFVDSAAMVGNMCMIGAGLMVLTCLLNIPRPVNFDVSTQTLQPSQGPLQSLAQYVPGDNRDIEPASRTSTSLGATFLTIRLGSAPVADVPAYHWLESMVATPGWLVRATSIISIIACGLTAIRLALGVIAAIRLSRQSVKLPHWQWPTLIRQFYKQHAGNYADVQIKVHAALASPCVHAFCPRTIFVPPAFLKWSEEEALTAFAHEFSHLQRRDSIWRLASEMSLLTIAFHPFSFWVRRQSILMQEIATDVLAAQLLGSKQRYECGLARLLLSCDSKQKTFAWDMGFGVGVSGLSFSSGLIRRIEMLKQGHGQLINKASHKKFGWFILAVMCAAIATCGSWRVIADEPPRVATLSTTSGKKVEPKLFGKSTIDSETTLPANLQNQSGFVRIDLAAAKDHPAIRLGLEFLQQIADRTDSPLFLVKDGGQPTTAEFGLKLDEIELIEAGIQANIRSIQHPPGTEAAAQDDSKFALTLGSNAFAIVTKEIVDWPNLLTALEPTQWNVSAENLQDIASTLEPTKRLSIGFESPAEGTSTPGSSGNLQHALEGTWNLCEGGFLTMAVQIPERGPLQNYLHGGSVDDDLTEEQRKLLLVLSSMSAMGVGIDFVPEQPGLTFRLVIEAKAGVTESQLVSYVEDFRSIIVTDALKTGSSESLIRAITNAEISIRQERDRSFAVMQFTYDPLLAILLGQ